ncbi:hypothetical protein B2G88_09190 [Natronolimnobius baerhuensis]|uniref:Uncharacterized protein n=2 Tax=Natronolimnobius baerhuensis TaxID=253108 RepID=A0A202EAD6_9EURY|nr:hypothetical protein B2G88_09190 [Natronolimnobius baerhuensis]
MSGVNELPARVNRGVFAALLVYFMLIGYAAVANQPLALLAAEIMFGLIAIGVGFVLYQQAPARESTSPLVIAAGCLIAGGVLQFGYLLTALGVLNDISSYAVFIGVGLYIYAMFVD